VTGCPPAKKKTRSERNAKPVHTPEIEKYSSGIAKKSHVRE